VVKGSLHPASLLTIVTPELYGVSGPLAYFWGPPSTDWGPTGLFLARHMGEVYFGALALAAAIGAGLPLRRADGDTRYFAVVALILGLYAVGRYTPAFDVLFHRSARFSPVSAAMACIGWRRARRNGARR
jgi:hypothetical protein